MNWQILRLMFKEMERMVEETYIPLLRLLVDDRDAFLKDYQHLVDTRVKLPIWASPYQRWWTNYGNFIRENEFALQLLQKHLSEEDFLDLVVSYQSERLSKRFEFIKKLMWKKIESGTNLHEEMQSAKGQKMLPVINAMSQFLVGPMTASMEADGTMLMDIPDCAMHRSVSDSEPQELSCLYACKAACESLFSPNDPMCFEFEPDLPGFGCTLRTYMEGHPVLESKRAAANADQAVKLSPGMAKNIA